MLQELKKDYSIETVLLASAKEKALSKKTWLDDLMAEKDNLNATSKSLNPDRTGKCRLRLLP